jgi:HSP20 family protein
MRKGEEMAKRQQRQPFRGLFDAVAELNRMREFWTAGVEAREGRTHATAWIPTMDIFATGEDLIIRCELAGIGRDDVAISLEHGALTIDGERTGAPADEETTYYVRERHYGAFRRTINLPEGIDKEDIAADLGEGLLEIRVRGAAAREEAERIEIGTAADEPASPVEIRPSAGEAETEGGGRR